MIDKIYIKRYEDLNSHKFETQFSRNTETKMICQINDYVLFKTIMYGLGNGKNTINYNAVPVDYVILEQETKPFIRYSKEHKEFYIETSDYDTSFDEELMCEALEVADKFNRLFKKGKHKNG